MPAESSPLNFQHRHLLRYWVDRDPDLARLLIAMDRMDTWALDGDYEVARALHALVPLLIRAPDERLEVQADLFLDLMTWMSSSRALRLVAFLDERGGARLVDTLLRVAAERLEQRAGLGAAGGADADGAALLLERLGTLSRMNLLARILRPDNIKRVTQVVRLLD